METTYEQSKQKFSLSSLHRALAFLNFSRRLVPDFNIKNTPEIKEKRKETGKYLLDLLGKNANIIYLDETSSQFNIFPKYGYF